MKINLIFTICYLTNTGSNLNVKLLLNKLHTLDRLDFTLLNHLIEFFDIEYVFWNLAQESKVQRKTTFQILARKYIIKRNEWK